MVRNLRIEWHADRYTRKLLARLHRGLQQAALDLADQIKEDFIDHYPPASTPGNVPHIRTGLLKANITFRVTKRGTEINAVIGTFKSAVSKYARALEYGTRHMKARPFLRPALARFRSKVIRILKRTP